MRSRGLLVSVLVVGMVAAFLGWRADETHAASTEALTRSSDGPAPAPVKGGPSSADRRDANGKARIEGEVVDDEGKPLDTATVELENVVSRAVVRLQTTPEGRFSVEVEAGEWDVGAVAPGYVEATFSPVLMAGAGTVISQLRLAMTPTRVITGVVLDESGLTVPDATVFIDGVVGVPRRPTRTDSYGRFRTEFNAKARGAFLSVRHDCCLDLAHRLPASAEPGDLTLRLRRVELERSIFSGVVVDVTGAPLADTQVMFSALVQLDGGAVQREARVVSDAHGAFSASLPGQVVLAFATSERGRSPPVTLLAGAPGKLVLEGSPASVTGRVTDEAGQPVTRFQVRVDGDGHLAQGLGRFASGDGRFRVALRSSGPKTVVVEADGFVSPVERSVTVLAEQPTTGIDFTLIRKEDP